MNEAVDNLQAAQQRGLAIRPKVGGFPVLAAVLLEAGVRRNRWILPAGQSIYWTDLGSVVSQGDALLTGTRAVPAFDRDSVIAAIRTDQAGACTFAEFLARVWAAGVLHYEVDFDARTCTYFGDGGENYVESYDMVNAADWLTPISEVTARARCSCGVSSSCTDG
jgi:uncharacterized protein YbcV (DUF1398 family)